MRECTRESKEQKGVTKESNKVPKPQPPPPPPIARSIWERDGKCEREVSLQEPSRATTTTTTTTKYKFNWFKPPKRESSKRRALMIWTNQDGKLGSKARFQLKDSICFKWVQIDS